LKIVNEFYFSIVPEWLIESNASDSAIRVYSALCRFADKDDGSCFPSHMTIGKKCNKSVSTVKRALKELEKIGAITIEPRFIDDKGQTSNLYTVKYLPIKNELSGEVKNELPPDSQMNYKLKSNNDSHISKQLEKQDKNKIRMTLQEHLNYKPQLKGEISNFNKTVKELYESNASLEDIVARIEIYKKKWSNIALTHEALRNNWTTLGTMVEENKTVEPRNCEKDGHAFIDSNFQNDEYKLFMCRFCTEEKKEYFNAKIG